MLKLREVTNAPSGTRASLVLDFVHVSNNLGYNGSKSFKLHFFQNFWGKQVEENAFE